jgi:hypothetical protein
VVWRDDERGEFAIDLSCDTDIEVVVACVPWRPTLAEIVGETIEKVGRWAKAMQEWEGTDAMPLSTNTELLVPAMDWRLNHRFTELEGDVGAGGEQIARAFQSIGFRLDRFGAAVDSDAAMIVVLCEDRDYIFNRPFLVMMRRRQAVQPFFAAWIGNAELLQPHSEALAPHIITALQAQTQPRDGATRLPAKPMDLQALAWLASVQQQNGAWPGPPQVTGWALLAFLHCGMTPLSDEHGLTVQKAMQWLGNRFAPGRHQLLMDPLPHAVCAYALAEAYRMTMIPFLREAARSAAQAIRTEGAAFPAAAWEVLALRAVCTSDLRTPELLAILQHHADLLTDACASSNRWRPAAVSCLLRLGEDERPGVTTALPELARDGLFSWRQAETDFAAEANRQLLNWYFNSHTMLEAGGRR